MSDGVRGKALIINIKNFNDPQLERKGSEEDYKNLVRLFTDLKFDVLKRKKGHTDLTALVSNSGNINSGLFINLMCIVSYYSKTL